VKLRSRGIHERTFGNALDEIVECWLDGTETFKVTETRFINITGALGRRNYTDTVGQWVEHSHEIKLLPQAKRGTALPTRRGPCVMLPTLGPEVVTRASHPYPHTDRWHTIVPTKPEE
jgi:hypothetical protein